MSDENTSLGEVTGLAIKEQAEAFDAVETVVVPAGEYEKVYQCRLERSLKEGEKPEAFDVVGRNTHEAAIRYAESLDSKNPRPPRERVVIVEYTDHATDTWTISRVRITCRPSITYDADIL